MIINTGVININNFNINIFNITFNSNSKMITKMFAQM